MSLFDLFQTLVTPRFSKSTQFAEKKLQHFYVTVVTLEFEKKRKKKITDLTKPWLRYPPSCRFWVTDRFQTLANLFIKLKTEQELNKLQCENKIVNT